MKKQCPNCNLQIISREKETPFHFNKRIFCDQKCFLNYRVGINNPVWKGDAVGYSGLHKWVRKKFGQPKKCEHCGENNLKGQKIHWANKSGDYSRDRKDWVRLCVKCHCLFDNNYPPLQHEKTV